MSGSWAPVPDGSGFGLDNLPYGVFHRASETPEAARVGVRIGDHVVDLARVAERVRFADASLLRTGTLDALMASGPEIWNRVRAWIVEVLTEPALQGPDDELVALSDVALLMPFTVADYVDFYSSEHHAENLGRMFRPDAEPLLPNWRHMPVGYHGRAGTVVVSGTPIARPRGQLRAKDGSVTFGPTRRLDIEAEIGWVVGVPSRLGAPVPVTAFREHVFGACVVNDWSARDIQAWEYVPLGPFLGKSFATSISPWIVPLDAFEAARVAPPSRSQAVLPYLTDDAEPWGLDITLEVEINGALVSRPPFEGMYWTPAQQLAHMTVNGASLRTGDLFASGTVSGTEPDQRGSLVELSWNGTQPIRLPDGSERTFLEDGDRVSIRATASGRDGSAISLGEVTGVIVRPSDAVAR